VHFESHRLNTKLKNYGQKTRRVTSRSADRSTADRLVIQNIELADRLISWSQ